MSAVERAPGNVLNDNRRAPFWKKRRLPVEIARPAPSAEPIVPAGDPFAEMRGWLGILHRMGVPVEMAARIASRADVNRTSFQDELLASGLCDETVLYRAVAADLGLRFLAEPDPQRLLVREQEFAKLLAPGSRSPVQYLAPDREPFRLLGHDALDLDALRCRLAGDPRLADRLVIVPRAALRTALRQRLTPVVGEYARDALFDRFPDCSARIVANAWQGCMIGALVMGLPIAFSLWPAATLLGLHAFMSLFFMACVLLRFRAARDANPPSLPKLAHVDARDLPTYSIMVALYREANVVPDLLDALDRIVWPKSKLEVKLVCEADDEGTLAALRARRLRSYVDIVEVSAIGPRTKPKALAFALPQTSGALVAVYDAEDRPHPLQLMEAWQTFRSAGADLACLQAPLVIANGRESWLARLFGFEYAALFRGLLPFLSRRGLVLPLGGTSNHFRRQALEEVGSWDPYNVTEDADLGLRLARFGYRSATIEYPTLEDAPTSLGVWLRQRTRWFKGWLQTWLVHMRHPLRLWREIGTGSFLIVQVLFAGMVVSALFHPMLLVTLAYLTAEIVWGSALDPSRSILFAIDSVNIFCGYAAFLALGAATLMPLERRRLKRVVVATPFYWMMISAAAWRAVWQLYSNPFLWEKTPHRPHGRARNVP